LDDDYYTQPGNLFRLMKPDERARLIDNIVTSMKNVPDHIQERQIWYFKKADLAYGAGVAEGLGWEIKDISFPPTRGNQCGTRGGRSRMRGEKTNR